MRFGRRSKYNSRRVEKHGVLFHSKREAGRYDQLLLMEKQKLIYDLKRQVKYRLEVNGVLICTYSADFVYTLPDGREVVEDVKGYRTPEYRLKAKLMLACHGITVQER